MHGYSRYRTWPNHTIRLPDIVNTLVPPSGNPVPSKIPVNVVLPGGSLRDFNNGPLLHNGKPVGKGNIGSSFTLLKSNGNYDGLRYVDRYSFPAGIYKYSISGPLVPIGNGHLNIAPPAITPTSTSIMNYWGTRAVAMCAPNNPLFDAATFIGEFRQIPDIVGRSVKRKGVKGVGDEILNYEFGIHPILRDSKNILDAGSKMESYLHYLQRNSGVQTRREVTLEDVKTVGPVVDLGLINSNFPNLPNNAFRQFRLTRVLTESLRVWFSGSFCYYYKLSPSESQFLKTFNGFRKTFGLNLSTEVVWNLLPYSWLAGWFTNTGSIAANLTRFSQDGLVMKYGYIMCELKSQYQYTYGPSTWTTETVSKQRIHANPFGFGINPANLSDRQWTILAALGQTKYVKSFT